MALRERNRRLAAKANEWKPLPGPQTEALNSKADILFYGGAAGGGKSDLLLGAAGLQHQRSIIFRREYPQLKGIVDRSLQVFAGQGTFLKSPVPLWELSRGRSIEFGAVQHAGDEQKYQGRAHDLKNLVPRRKLWVVEGMLVGSTSPDGTANCALATRIAVKSCACGAPLRGCGT